MDAELLQNIGLTDGETKVYLSLIRLGETKTGPLANHAEVSSSKVYKILDRLIKKGLVGYVKKGKISYFSPLEPKRILDYMEKKEQELKQKRDIIKKIIPELESEQNNTKQPEAIVYNGFKAVTNFFRNMLDDLKKGEKYYVIGATYGKDIEGLREFFYNYHKQRDEKGIKVKMLANHDTKGNIEKTTQKNAEIKYLPQYFVSNMQITFYKNKAFITLWTENPTGFLIKNEEAVKSFTSYFEALWKIAK